MLCVILSTNRPSHKIGLHTRQAYTKTQTYTQANTYTQHRPTYKDIPTHNAGLHTRHTCTKTRTYTQYIHTHNTDLHITQTYKQDIPTHNSDIHTSQIYIQHTTQAYMYTRQPSIELKY